ncbi:putative exosome component 4 [Hordeum vulgare]|nr:putative exosome component 4 [Hordeum vulgare]
MPEETSAPSKDPPKKDVRKFTTTLADLRAPEYDRKSTELSKDAPAKKAGVKRPSKRTVHLVGRKTSIVQGMEKNIQDIMQNQKSLERVVETNFHNMDVKITELTTIVIQLQHEVDSVEIPRLEDEDEDEDDDDDEDESPPPTTTRFSTRPRPAAVPAQETDSLTMEYVNPLTGFRFDRRRPNEMQQLKGEVGVVSRADGSVLFEMGNTRVISTVYGPREVFCHV